MAKLYNLAKMTTVTIGTGPVTLDTAVTGCLSFIDAGVQDGDVVSYGIIDGDSSEVGRGTFTVSGEILDRTTILKSTNSDAALNLSGSAQVFITALAEDIGNVLGNASVTDGHLAVFDGDGYHIKDGGPVRGPATNLITNGYFTADNSGWTATSPATITQSSGRGVVSRVNSSINDYMVYQDVTVVSGQLYLVQVDLAAVSASGQMRFNIIDNGVTRTIAAGATSITTFNAVHLAASTTLRVAFSVQNDETGTITIDNVFVVPL